MIVTLCGSARFERLFKAYNEAFTLAGHTVFSLAVYPSDKAGVKNWYNHQQKARLDEAHLEKIDASHAIFVINAFAYIGESTMREIEHAKRTNKHIAFKESWGKGYGIGHEHFDSVQKAALALGVPVGYGSPIDTFIRGTGYFDMCDGGPDGYGLLGPAGATRSHSVGIINAAVKEVMGCA